MNGLPPGVTTQLVQARMLVCNEQCIVTGKMMHVGAAEHHGNGRIHGNQTITGNSKIIGDSSMVGDAVITGRLRVSEGLTVKGGVKFHSELKVGGKVLAEEVAAAKARIEALTVMDLKVSYLYCEELKVESLEAESVKAGKGVFRQLKAKKASVSELESEAVVTRKVSASEIESEVVNVRMLKCGGFDSPSVKKIGESLKARNYFRERSVVSAVRQMDDKKIDELAELIFVRFLESEEGRKRGEGLLVDARHNCEKERGILVSQDSGVSMNLSMDKDDGEVGGLFATCRPTLRRWMSHYMSEDSPHLDTRNMNRLVKKVNVMHREWSTSESWDGDTHPKSGTFNSTDFDVVDAGDEVFTDFSVDGTELKESASYNPLEQGLVMVETNVGDDVVLKYEEFRGADIEGEVRVGGTLIKAQGWYVDDDSFNVKYDLRVEDGEVTGYIYENDSVNGDFDENSKVPVELPSSRLLSRAEKKRVLLGKSETLDYSCAKQLSHEEVGTDFVEIEHTDENGMTHIDWYTSALGSQCGHLIAYTQKEGEKIIRERGYYAGSGLIRYDFKLEGTGYSGYIYEDCPQNQSPDVFDEKSDTPQKLLSSKRASRPHFNYMKQGKGFKVVY